MPSRPSSSTVAKKTCYCEECLVNGGKDPDGRPKGVQFTLAAYAGHMAAVALRKEQRIREQAEYEKQERQRAIATMEEDIIGLVLTDDGPDLDNQPSKLWTSRAEFQEGVTTPSRVPEPAVDDLARTLGHMSLFSGPEDAGSPSGSDNHQPSPPDPKLFKKYDKRENDHRTVKSKNILEAIRAQIRTSAEKLVNKPTHEILQDVEVKISQMRSSMEKITRTTWSLEQLKRKTSTEMQSLEARVLECRNLLPQVPLTFSNDRHWNLPIDNLSPTAQIAILLGVVCSVIMGVSRRNGDLIMSFICMTLLSGFMLGRGGASQHQEKILSEIPTNITEALSKFNFEGQTTVYAVCPRCHFTYKPEIKRGSSRAIYPEVCTNTPHPGSKICNEALLETRPDDADDAKSKPRRTFVYHSFHDYLGGLLARKDLEEMMDKACDDLKESMKGPSPNIVTDVFEADFLKSFEWKDGTMFVDRKGVEGRFAFTLNIDFFSVEGSHHGGASASVGIISMACLNLPPEIRYKAENMFLAGIIPGPFEPHQTELNHYVKPVIDDMEKSWDQGVRYSRTASYRMGRMTHSAIAAVVCDLPAARLASQFANHTGHHLCTVCNCFHKSNIHRTNWQNWISRSNEEWREQAEKWRDAETPQAQDKIFDTYGVRWSEFWRLPYWNPTRQLVIDVMHCILEGVTHHYFREAMGLTEKSSSAPAPRPAYVYNFKMPHPADETHGLSRDEVDEVYLIHGLLQKPIEDKETKWTDLVDKVAAKRTKSIQYVLDDLQLTHTGKVHRVTRKVLAGVLVDWRKRQPLQSNKPPHIPLPSSAILERIREVIKDTTTPSWVRSVPPKFGAASAGSLKADEWRTMCTIYLPLALISMWGKDTPSPLQPPKSLKSPPLPPVDHARSLLHLTMLLVSAVRIACMRTMTTEHATAYRTSMSEYLTLLREVLPNASLRENDHMAMHVFDFLMLFGPVRSWWCFPYERLIGQLQRIPHNHKFGELEPTMLQTFIKAGKLKRWLSRPDCPDAIKECKALFDKAYTHKSNNNTELLHGEELFVDDLSNETLPSTLQTTPKDLRALLHRDQVALSAHHKRNGIVYARSSTHLGNSLVRFHAKGDRTAPPIPASIKYIFSDGNKISYAVQRQLPLKANIFDPFALYPYFPAKLYSSQVSQDLEIIEVNWVASHFARWQLSQKYSVVLSLSSD